MDSWIRDLNLYDHIVFWDKETDPNLEEYRIYKSLDGGNSWDIVASGISAEATQYTIRGMLIQSNSQMLLSTVSVINGTESSKDITKDIHGERYLLDWADMEGVSQFKIYKGAI
ncbi:MAG: hypothetical protein DRH33_03270 [Candidatus Nealsonbacteria bacterium]|nr:MAG: hypothetical protein DRH33_03270 [Candidatus Nealsonbacteria bacterium]